MLNPAREFYLAGSHYVSPFDFDPEVTAAFDFPSPLELIDSTLRKTHFTAGHITSRRGYQRIAAALVELGVRDESINISWSRSDEPAPQDWALLEAIVEGDFDFRLNVYTDTLLGDGRHLQPVSMRQTVDMLVAAGVQVAAPGIVPAPDPDAQARQIDDLAEYFDYAGSNGLDTTITFANVGRRDFACMLAMANLAVSMGARRLDLMDSTSSLTPEAMKVFIRRFREGLTVEVPLTMHVHDEFGLATAGAIAAATAGASPDVSLNGMSYRAGFAPLEEVVLALETLYGVDTGLRLEQIQHTAEVVATESGVALPPLKPLTGTYAYLKHMPGDAAAAITTGQDAFPPISHGLVPAKMGQRVEWVWGGLSFGFDGDRLGHPGRSGSDAAEVAVARRALDATVRLVPRYPRWLTPAVAAQRLTEVVSGLRTKRSSEDVGAALATACPYEPWVAKVLDAAGTADSAALIVAARSVTLAVRQDDLVAMASTFSSLGSDDGARDLRAQLSRSEEAGLSASPPGVIEEIVTLANDYDQRFGYRYVVSTAGLGGIDIAERLRHRLTVDAAVEERTTRVEMATIIDNRLIRMLAAPESASPPPMALVSGGGGSA